MNLLKGLGFSIVEQERWEAYERGMAHAARLRAEKARAEKAREQRLGPARARTGWRSITRDEAIAIIGKRNPRGAFKLQSVGYTKPGGRR
jgi:hypothetical protein